MISVFWIRVGYTIILVALTCCYIFGDVIQSWRNWVSGLAYGIALSGLLQTFKYKSQRRRVS